ncbi:branched-chain amino acid transport system II carrier protein, partial [Intestinibacillus massiliensis]|nr:branched-chain amino acid transport system II carrier protein [Intestinibacillus massiliensis]
MGPISETPMLENVAVDGINAGYQTMDVLAALAFGIIIVKTVTEKGYTDTRLKYKVVCNSSLIAALGLLLVYCGLTYLGAAASTFYNLDVNRSQLIIDIIEHLMGKTGVVVLGIVVALACLTTAVALVS